MAIDTDTIKMVWEKARKVQGLDPSMFRLDACGALIMFERYGKENPYGWVIDHIFPVSLGGDDNAMNLRAFHYRNNLSKRDDYPSYTAVIKYNGKGNMEEERNLTVNDKVRASLKKIYKNA